uniref:Putative salp15 n=1 Tax=Ixodes ricinus TaxID=34613 RepID=A0A0K8RHW4_IXORI
MVDDSMKNTGLLFFIMRTTRLIVAMFVLFAICKPAVANVAIKGTQNMAPNCDKKIQDLCKNHTAGKLEEVNVRPRECRATCIYRPDSTSDVVYSNGIPVRNRNYEQVTLPEKMPCAFGARCDKHGNCICKSCNENINNKGPR